MRSQTFGVEIEMNHITRQRAAQLAAGFFGTERYENTAYRNRYMTWSAWDRQGYYRTFPIYDDGRQRRTV